MPFIIAFFSIEYIKKKIKLWLNKIQLSLSEKLHPHQILFKFELFMLAFKTVLIPGRLPSLSSFPWIQVLFTVWNSLKVLEQLSHPHVSIHPIIPLLHNPIFAIQHLLTVVIYLFPSWRWRLSCTSFYPLPYLAQCPRFNKQLLNIW